MGFKFHVPLLAFADFQRGAVEYVKGSWNHVRRQFGQGLVGQYQHGISGEDGGVGIPPRVDGGLAAAQGRRVHDVVVDEGKIVEEFHGVCGGQCGTRVGSTGLGTQEHQHGAQPFAAQFQEIALGGVQPVGRAIQCGTREFVGQIVPIKLGKRFQLLHVC